jgi:transketolase
LPPDEVKAIKSLLGLDPENKNVFPTTPVSDIRESNRKRRIDYLGTENTLHSNQELEMSRIIEAIQEIQFPDVISTRKANGIIINEIKNYHPWTLGGSADLTESNGLSLNNLFDPQRLSAEVANNLIFGVREHAMSAITNGLSLDYRNITYCATYLGFSDYQKPAIRLSALMNLPITYVWTHDSIALGADGPTHQPIEHLAALRAIPNFAVIRPGSASELKEAWGRVLKERKPVGFVLSRQDLPNIKAFEGHSSNSQKGGYTYVQNFVGEFPKVILIATGSELELAKEVAFDLRLANHSIRVVSMPCWEWFEEEIEQYRQSVIPSTAGLIVSIEAASTFGWEKFTGLNGLKIGIDTFGESGVSDALMKKFGFAAGQIVSKILERLNLPEEEKK